MTSNLTPERQAIVDRYAGDVDSLKAFANAEASHRSRRSYMPPLNNREYGKVIEALGKMAQRGPKLAAVAHKTLAKVNPYGDRAQACASVYSAFAEALRGEFFDVARAASPEPGRYSDNHKSFSLADKILCLAWANVILAGLTDSTGGHGWALVALAEREGINLAYVS